MKLSKTQKEVLKLMGEGWELGSSGGAEPRYWLQKGGIGRGGETKDIRSTTLFSLSDKGLIGFATKSHPFTCYQLTEEGRTQL